MPAPAWENLDDFLDTADFAVSVLLRLEDGTERTVPVIFDDPYLNAELGEYDLDTSRPRATGKASDFVGVTRGATAVIDGQEYDVMTEPQLDGTGMAMLAMARKA